MFGQHEICKKKRKYGQKTLYFVDLKAIYCVKWSSGLDSNFSARVFRLYIHCYLCMNIVFVSTSDEKNSVQCISIVRTNLRETHGRFVTTDEKYPRLTHNSF